jgi:hypothetical protein
LADDPIYGNSVAMGPRHRADYRTIAERDDQRE